MTAYLNLNKNVYIDLIQNYIIKDAPLKKREHLSLSYNRIITAYAVLICYCLKIYGGVNLNNKLVITLERQFGSGGLEIGQLVAQKLGIPCFNKEILEQAAKECSIPEEYLESAQENVSQSFLYQLSMASQQGLQADQFLSKSNVLYAEIEKIIKKMAQNGSCVIIGRCADYILRDFEPAFHVFVYATMEKRMQRVIESYGVSESSAEYIIKKNDKRREAFYNGNTNHTWGIKEHYNLCLNSGTFGIDRCADIIIDSLNYI